MSIVLRTPSCSRPAFATACVSVGPRRPTPRSSAGRDACRATRARALPDGYETVVGPQAIRCPAASGERTRRSCDPAQLARLDPRRRERARRPAHRGRDPARSRRSDARPHHAGDRDRSDDQPGRPRGPPRRRPRRGRRNARSCYGFPSTDRHSRWTRSGSRDTTSPNLAACRPAGVPAARRDGHEARISIAVVARDGALVVACDQQRRDRTRHEGHRGCTAVMAGRAHSRRDVLRAAAMGRFAAAPRRPPSPPA